MSFEPVNDKVVRAHVSQSQPVLARRGAMLGYDGSVTFRPVHGQGSGVRGAVGAAMAGESSPMMATEGTGRVLYGYKGMHVTILQLNNESLFAEADRLLAHDANLQTSVQFIGEGGLRAAVRGAMTGQGLFTTQVSGNGAVALLSHGGAFPIPVNPGEVVGVDPQAYVGHVGALQVGIAAKVGWRDAVGKGSGEAFQLKVSGSGTVYVQASEQKF